VKSSQPVSPNQKKGFPPAVKYRLFADICKAGKALASSLL
jgi:hypothetical protein